MTEFNFLHLSAKDVSITILVLIMVIFLLVIGFFYLLSKIRQLKSRLDRLLPNGAADLESSLVGYMNRVEEVELRVLPLERAVANIQAELPLFIRYSGLVRYNAFEDVGGEQSFSLALLDSLGDGLIISGVYSRNDVRVYAKSILNGRPSHNLSQEETNVLRDASRKPKE